MGTLADGQPRHRSAGIAQRSPTVPQVNASDLHTNGAWVVVVLNGIAGCWALAAHWRRALSGRALWVFTAVAQVTVLVQVTLGVIALQADGVEASDFHMFYGFLTIAAVGIIYSYQQQLTEWRHLLYGGGGLFIMGLALRSIFLG